MQLQVRNWEKYNPRRRDQKTFHWFRFDHDFFFNKRVFKLSESDMVVWIFVLCEASRSNNGGHCEFELSYAAHTMRKDEASVGKSLHNLIRNGHVTDTSRTCNEHVPLHNITEQDITEENRTNSTEHNKHNTTQHNKASKEGLSSITDYSDLWRERGGENE